MTARPSWIINCAQFNKMLTECFVARSQYFVVSWHSLVNCSLIGGSSQLLDLSNLFKLIKVSNYQ